MVARATGERTPKRTSEPSFRFLRGVRLVGTNIACDAQGGELVFLSHAQALGALGRRRSLPGRASRQELLVTEATLALLEEAGTQLRKRSLPTPFGRPFSLGAARVELFPSGYLPGSASLLVEIAGRRLLYAGTVRTGQATLGAVAAELRSADAICIDGTFGDPRYVFPPAEAALAATVAFVKQSMGQHAAAVLLTPPFGTALDVAAALAASGFGVRGHRAMVAAAAAFRATGAKVPAIARFAGKLGPEEVLLWPPEAREAPLLGQLGAARFAFVSGFSLDPEAMAHVKADVAIPLSNQTDYAQLLAYVEGTGAREVAVHRGHTETLAAALRARGLDAYPMGPPRQMDLFRG
jgi:putative mRNA 3-end processing factor